MRPIDWLAFWECIKQLFDFLFLKSFLSEFLATVIGAGLGVGGAIWLNRRQEKRNILRERQEEFERKRKILQMIRMELNDNYLNIADVTSDDFGDKEMVILGAEMKDEAWRALSDGGELQWIKDPLLISNIAWTYSKIRYVKYLSDKLFDLTKFKTDVLFGTGEGISSILWLEIIELRKNILNTVDEIEGELPGVIQANKK